MYLRLKPCALDSWLPPSAPDYPAPYPLQPSTARLLKQRLAQNFDWRAGGPKSLIKYIDLPVIEYLVAKAACRDHSASAMLARYIDGAVNLFVPDLGLVCQYSTGTQWNNRNRMMTLGGQAVALRALSLAARCDIAQQIFAFAGEIADELAESISKILTAHNIRRFFNGNRTVANSQRDWWWAIAAAHSYALATGNQAMRMSLEALFDHGFRTNSALAEGSDRALKHPGINADTCLAFAAAMRQFGETRCDSTLIDAATACLVRASRVFRHCSGGYLISATICSANRSVDIDVSIEFVRLAAHLNRLSPSSELAAAMRHGMRVLANPRLAIARPWDAGILLANKAYSTCDGSLVPISISRLGTSRHHDASTGKH